MKVTFAHFGQEIASSRLRAIIPQQELAKLGIGQGRDVLVYGKHILTFGHLVPFGKRIFDICDDHFNNPEFGPYYRAHAGEADALTCNSEVMREVIRRETGREAVVIPEPYEGEESPPDIGSRLIWYGHASNLADLERLKPHLRHPLQVLTNAPGFDQWTPQAFSTAIGAPCIVVIPTGKSQAKSENRMVEAIRRGRYVCAEDLPAYRPFEQFMSLGDIPAHIESALQDREAAKQSILAAQDYIRGRYAPATIAQLWLEVIRGTCELQ